jgi:hypothetical protein
MISIFLSTNYFLIDVIKFNIINNIIILLYIFEFISIIDN